MENSSFSTNESLISSSVNNSSPILSPADFMEFHIGTAVNTYGPPVITILGTIGNILSAAVMAYRAKRLSSPDLYIAVLAGFDLSMLWIGLFQYWILFNFFAHLITETHCHVMYFVVNFLYNSAVWIIVAMSFERLIAVVFPLKASILCSLKKTGVVIGCLIFLSVVKNFHYFWTSDFRYNPKTGAAQCAFGLVRTGAWVIAVQWLDTCLSSLVPFVLILGANCAIIVKIQKQKKSMKAFDQPGSKTKPRSTSDTGITLMLVSVSITFVILTSPLLILRTAFTFIKQDSAYIQAAYYLGHHVCHKLWYLNNAVNFYLYCITGALFRRDLTIILQRLVFCPGRMVRSLRDRTTSAASGSISMDTRSSSVQETPQCVADVNPSPQEHGIYAIYCPDQ